jgi:hypothetical protein
VIGGNKCTSKYPDERLGLSFWACSQLYAQESPTNAASGPEIDFEARATLDLLFHEVWSSHELANQAVGILVFPTVVKAGFWIGQGNRVKNRVTNR